MEGYRASTGVLLFVAARVALFLWDNHLLRSHHNYLWTPFWWVSAGALFFASTVSCSWLLACYPFLTAALAIRIVLTFPLSLLFPVQFTPYFLVMTELGCLVVRSRLFPLLESYQRTDSAIFFPCSHLIGIASLFQVFAFCCSRWWWGERTMRGVALCLSLLVTAYLFPFSRSISCGTIAGFLEPSRHRFPWISCPRSVG